MKIFIPGGSGLVGLNLIAKLIASYPSWELTVVDKKSEAVDIAKLIFPSVKFIVEDLCLVKNQRWPKVALSSDACVMLQAEIGNKDKSMFYRNNIESTKNILNVIQKNKGIRLIHVSSSVVNSISNDEYTQTKREQERLVLSKFKNQIVLRPTLMFGWFDRKHMGWLSLFMKKTPIFPIPGNGNFIRQPLFVNDFCEIIKSCLEDKYISGTFNISGLEKITYSSLMKKLRNACGARCLLINIPIPVFSFLLKIWSFISKKPAFTNSQLMALIGGDEFEVINWPKIFKIKSTKISDALIETHQNKQYSKVTFPF